MNIVSHKSLSLGFLFLIAGIACSQEKNVQPPEGMVFFPGGEIIIGAENSIPNEAPAFRTKVDAFFMDVYPVTVAEFRKFVNETGYVTEAEKFGDSALLHSETGEWILAEGAYWEYPLGMETGKAQDDHPVTHVSWNDANAYAEWAGRRLPSEIEWEYAAKSGKNSGQLYSWGNRLVKDGEYQANVWQGNFPYENTEEDGFRYTSPVGFFGKTEAGLTDMGGNVWEWTSDTYRLYEGNPHPFRVNPDLKVIRGGSFLCHENVCYSYRVAARQNNSHESASFHIGFRTAQDIR
jgi:sulfatase modifying factor 1